MSLLNELEAIFGRLDRGTCTHHDKQVLAQWILEQDPSLISQLGKYNISISEGRDIHIGDRFIIEFSEVSSQQLIEALQKSGLRLDNNAYEYLEVLETVDLNSELIEVVNKRLILLESIRDERRLSDSQKLELQEIQKRVRVVNGFNQDLKLIYRQAKQLLQNVQTALSIDLQNIKTTSNVLIANQSKIDSLSDQLEILNNFTTALEEGNRASQLILQAATQLKKTAGSRALNQFPEIQDSSTSKEKDDFYFSIEQFLEQIAHALKLGDHTIFENSEIPLSFNSVPLYLAVFQHIKEMFPKKSLSPIAIEQIEECLDDLIESLDRLY